MTSVAIGRQSRLTPPALLVALVRSSVWVSAAVSAMLYYTGHLLGATVPAPVYVLAFFSALFVMNFDHLIDARFEAPPDAPPQTGFTIAAGVLAVIAAAAILYLLTLVSNPVRIVVACYGAIGVIYGLPLFPVFWRRPVAWRRLKDVYGIKAWLVSAAIVFAMIGLPMASSGAAAAPLHVAIIAAATYLFIVSNAHMFDVRDIRYDRLVGNTTLPALIGVERTRRALTIANVVALVVVAAAQLGGFFPFHPETLLGVLLTIAYVRLLPAESSGVQYAIIIDGCLFVMPIAARVHEILGGGTLP
jgi:4-hydroxybenzoate polyprenyltransferase